MGVLLNEMPCGVKYKFYYINVSSESLENMAALSYYDLNNVHRRGGDVDNVKSTILIDDVGN